MQQSDYWTLIIEYIPKFKLIKLKIIKKSKKVRVKQIEEINEHNSYLTKF